MCFTQGDICVKILNAEIEKSGYYLKSERPKTTITHMCKQ